MQLKSITSDRKRIVRALEELTGENATYLGAPGFAYEIGPYTVDRTGNIIVENPDPNVMDTLIGRELVANPDVDLSETIITIPMTDCDGTALRNLVNMLYSKNVLMGKAAGRPGFYFVSESLVREMAAKEPKTAEDFPTIISDAYDGDLQGLSFENGKISFHYP